MPARTNRAAASPPASETDVRAQGRRIDWFVAVREATRLRADLELVAGQLRIAEQTVLTATERGDGVAAWMAVEVEHCRDRRARILAWSEEACAVEAAAWQRIMDDIARGTASR